MKQIAFRTFFMDVVAVGYQWWVFRQQHMCCPSLELFWCMCGLHHMPHVGSTSFSSPGLLSWLLWWLPSLCILRYGLIHLPIFVVFVSFSKAATLLYFVSPFPPTYTESFLSLSLMDVRLCAGECRSSDFKPYGPLLSIPLLVCYHEVNMDCPSRNGFSKVSLSRL